MQLRQEMNTKNWVKERFLLVARSVKQLLPALHARHGLHVFTPVGHLLFLSGKQPKQTEAKTLFDQYKMTQGILQENY